MARNDTAMRAKMAQEFREMSFKKGDGERLLEETREKLFKDMRDYGVPTTLSHIDAMLLGIRLFASIRQNDGDELAAVLTASIMYVAEDLKGKKDEIMKGVK